MFPQYAEHIKIKKENMPNKPNGESYQCKRGLNPVKGKHI